MNNINYFTASYEESRTEFRKLLELVKRKWPNAELTTTSIGRDEDNTIDTIYAEAIDSNNQVVFLTCGEHGIEGYAGAAVIRMFTEKYLNQINPAVTGICLIHALNPWGMKNYRRVTENNVDLNRNCFYHPDSIPLDINQNYEEQKELFLPNGKVKDIKKEKTDLYHQLSRGMADQGYQGIKKAKGMGQYEFKKGVYYGGVIEEESTAYLKQMQREILSTFPHVVHMDWHTALGPEKEVTLVISEHEPRSEEEIKEDYKLENIQKYSPKKVKGDSTNHFYKLKNEEFPDTQLFSALFEFGTFGADREAELREISTIILENQLYWEGAEREEDRQWILKELNNMFYPSEEEWRSAVMKEAQLAVESVLRKEGVI
ncbi:M14 family metallopeptidase [Halobacillus sp. A5]|uniref:M14 family metallopeptidase n=1 Tax=Halobacillus sp. A5 TaxID=2880263 RepID=UPI0020A62358|nr:M14 family metallopeptidase [Halobacillus sp. A5]MCP3027966.1 M14 family metallopeptidase [Halobacillus sp. A5]